MTVDIFNAVFHYWARKENRLDLLNTNKSNVIQNINQIEEWRHLRSFRRNSEPRKYAVGFKPGAVMEEMAETIKIKGQPVPELRAALVAAANSKGSA